MGRIVTEPEHKLLAKVTNRKELAILQETHFELFLKVTVFLSISFLGVGYFVDCFGIQWPVMIFS
jgi:hypothetical protein